MSVRNQSVQSVSAFFPCYNDEHSIPIMVKAVRAALVETVDDFEIIVVDDGSSDGSVTVLEAMLIEVPELTIVRHAKNRGYGGALISGFAAASKQWVFYTDGDSQYNASEITRCIDAVRSDTDVVQGWKIQRGDRWYRKAIGWGYHHTVRLLFNLHVRDIDCDFRLIRSTLMDRVRLTSTSGVVCLEMMRKFERAGAKFVEVGVSHFERPFGRSQFFRLPAIARSARQLTTLWWRLIIRRGRTDDSLSTVS